MTDHGGAASPRTEAITSLHNAIREANVLGLEDATIPVGHAITLRDLAIEAAQEAPAPEGLRDEWTDERRPEDDAECERLGCEDRTHPVHHRVGAEARPPEGLEAAYLSDAMHGATEAMAAALPVIAAVRAWRDTPRVRTRGESVARVSQRLEQAVLDAIGGFDDHAAQVEEAAARLSAGGATKP